jgi:hypothetical protein
MGVVAPACAQGNGDRDIPKSQLGSVMQSVAGTRIVITYRRPVARGRALFGALVPWGRMWTPSADSAAVLESSGPLEVNGAALPAGTYSIWAIPERDTWTVIFNATPHTFHLAYPEGRDVLRVHATPKQGEHMETLGFYFPSVDADSATLYLHWGTTIVPLSLRATNTTQ